MTAEISIRLYWLPGGTTGHILLHRRMPWSPGHSLDEYWRSGPVGELAAATLDLAAQSTADWQQLLVGLPLPKVTMPATPHPVVLHGLGRETLRDVLPRAGVACDIAGASLRFVEVGGVLEVVGGRLDGNRFEPVALGITPFLRRILDDLALARSAGPPAPAAAAPAPGDELRAGLGSAIRLHDTRGVQIGDHNTQRNTFRYTVTDSPRVSALLRQDLDLARDLADYLCPAAGDVGDLTTLRSQVDRSLSGLGIKLDRNADQQLRAPLPGNKPRIFRTDGLTVGDHNVQSSTREVRLTVRRLRLPDPTELSRASPATERPEVHQPKIPDRTVTLPTPGIGIGGR